MFNVCYILYSIVIIASMVVAKAAGALSLYKRHS